MKRFVIAVLLVSAVACGKRSEPAGGSGSGSGSAAGSAVGSSGSASTEPPIDDPTAPVVKAAFGGHVPAFPRLSKGGQTAAVVLEAQLVLTSVTTYSVAFVGTSGAPVVTPLVDAKLAQVLLEGSSSDGKPAKIDTAAVAAAASAVTKRLQDEGFSAFEKKIEELAVGEPTAAGPAKLQLAEAEN